MHVSQRIFFILVHEGTEMKDGRGGGGRGASSHFLFPSSPCFLWCVCRVRAAVLPVVLGLQELKLVFDPVTGLGHGELEARLTRLVRCLQTVGDADRQLELYI